MRGPGDGVAVKPHFGTQRPQGGLAAVRGHGDGVVVKPHCGTKNRAPACTGAISSKPAEKHPAEGMTKVIPALSCKHDNCEAHGMRERIF